MIRSVVWGSWRNDDQMTKIGIFFSRPLTKFKIFFYGSLRSPKIFLRTICFICDIFLQSIDDLFTIFFYDHSRRFHELSHDKMQNFDLFITAIALWNSRFFFSLSFVKFREFFFDWLIKLFYVTTCRNSQSFVSDIFEEIRNSVSRLTDKISDLLLLRDRLIKSRFSARLFYQIRIFIYSFIYFVCGGEGGGSYRMTKFAIFFRDCLFNWFCRIFQGKKNHGFHEN